MSHAEAIHRSWVILEIGTTVLVLAALQILTGRTPKMFAITPGWVKREKEPREFWSNLSVWLAIGIFAVILALTRLLGFSN